MVDKETALQIMKVRITALELEMITLTNEISVHREFIRAIQNAAPDALFAHKYFSEETE